MAAFSAVLLAGGKSSRMGRDKALLPVPHSDLLLWQRQLNVLEELGPDEIFWSGPSRPGLPAGLRIAEDEKSQAGPLAGICTCLKRMSGDLLVVLAIDLPRMTSSFLRELQIRCRPDQGVIPHNGDVFEPLAAIYPRRIQTLAEDHLSQGRYALQDLLKEAHKQKLIQKFRLDEKRLDVFQNWNEPATGN